MVPAAARNPTNAVPQAGPSGAIRSKRRLERAIMIASRDWSLGPRWLNAFCLCRVPDIRKLTDLRVAGLWSTERSPLVLTSGMSTVKWLLIVLAVGYATMLAAMFFWQRALMYFPERTRTAPAAAGLAGVEEVTLDTADGEKLLAWYRPAADGKLVILYFHGNGGSLRLRAERFLKLTADGTGLLAVSYRGY